MEESIQESLFNIVVASNNDKVKKETLEEFLKSYTVDKLVHMAMTAEIGYNNYDELERIYSYRNKAKKEILGYIKDNLEKIVTEIILCIKPIVLEDLQEILKHQEEFDYNYIEQDISFATIMNLKNFNLAKFEYIKKDNRLKIYIPKEIRELLTVILNDKAFLAKKHSYDESYQYLDGILDAYGIISYDKLYDIYTSQIGTIDKTELLNIINLQSYLDEHVVIHIYPEGYLICNAEFYDYDYAISFYENQRGSYKKFSKGDYAALADATYVEKLSNYKKFVAYLKENFYGIEDGIEDVKHLIVLDYIYQIQTDNVNAEDTSIDHIRDTFGLSIAEATKLHKMVKDIYKEYPKWRKKGNI